MIKIISIVCSRGLNLMKLQAIFFVLGLLLVFLGTTMIAPALLDWYLGDANWEVFAQSAILTLLAGGLCSLANRPHGEMALSIRETFLMTAMTWLALSAFAALPFIFSTITATHTDSFFEAISALTTTGASVISGLDFVPKGILLWRSILQWLGGIGIIVMALTVMPILHIGGMHLFRSEFSDRSEKVLPRVSQITKAIFWTYVFLTLLCALALWFAGMSIFEAACYSMTTVSTGGMSTSDASIAYFDNVAIEIIMITFMAVGGSTLLLYVRLFRGEIKTFWQDSQTRIYFALLVLFPSAIALWRWRQDVPFASSVRESFFNGISILTTSGFSTEDYGNWGTLPVILFFIMMFIGGCTGSTAGGIKVFRFKVIYQLTRIQIYKLYRPHAVVVPTYNRQQIPTSIFDSVITFIALFLLSFAVLAIGLAAYDLDFMTSISGAIAALSNIGPGFGTLIGPRDNYALAPEGAKWLLMAGMILGRLELLTIFVLFTPKFWKD